MMSALKSSAKLIPAMVALAWAQSVQAAKAGDNSERLAGNIDSWIALGMILLSLIVAWSLNGERQATRKAGIVLAGLGCLGITAWFVTVNASGVLDAPKAAVTPLDAAKPTLLVIQAGLSALAGLFLIAVGLRSDHAPLDDTSAAEVKAPIRYSLVSRYLHWTTAILFLSLFPMGIFMTMLPEDVSYRQGYYVVHKTIGLLILGLLLLRVLWNFLSARPALDPSLKPWEARLAHGVHRTLYVLIFAFPISGFIMSTFSGKLSHFFIWDTPLLWEANADAVLPWGLAHKILLPYLTYLIFGAHIGGVLKHHFVDGRRDAIRRMVGQQN
jgi:cytochrome b561